LSNPFVYLWAYEVLPEKVDDFLMLYGPNGSWVALFREAPGYLDTQLLRDRTKSYRFVTVDRWESREAFTSFRTTHSEEFDRLDHLGEQLTSQEVLLGEFVATT
jgi:heme-degrading monooxygenase HmoA